MRVVAKNKQNKHSKQADTALLLACMQLQLYTRARCRIVQWRSVKLKIISC